MKTLLSTLLIGLCSISFASIPSPKTTPIQSLNQIAAVVNNEVITDNELQHSIDTFQKRFSAQGVQLPGAPVFRQQVLNHLINTKLQLQMAKRAHITASNADVNQAIAKIAAQNHMSTRAFEQKVHADQGLSASEFRKMIKDQLLISKTQRAALMPSITVSDKAVNQAYQHYLSQGQMASKYHLKDILLSLPSNPTSQQLQKALSQANQLMTQLQNGADFSQLARAHSVAGNALQGGDMGWRKLGEIPEIFAAQVRKMKAGDIAGPIRAANGLHIIKLEGIKHSKSTVSKTAVRNMLLERKFNEKLQGWLQHLRSSAYVKIYRN